MAGSSAAATSPTARHRLYLRKAARPARQIERATLRNYDDGAEGISPSDAHRLLAQLETIKENVRNAIQDRERSN